MDRKWDPGIIPYPGYYWRRNARRDQHPDALKSAFEEIGYELCSNGDFEEGFRKVALYEDTKAIGLMQQGKRSMENGAN